MGEKRNCKWLYFILWMLECINDKCNMCTLIKNIVKHACVTLQGAHGGFKINKGIVNSIFLHIIIFVIYTYSNASNNYNCNFY